MTRVVFLRHPVLDRGDFHVVPPTLRDELALPLAATADVVEGEVASLPDADFVVCSQLYFEASLQRRLGATDGRRLVLLDVTYSDSARLLDTHPLAAAVESQALRHGRAIVDGLREVGRRIGAEEVDAYSMHGAWRSRSYASLAIPGLTLGALLGRYLAAYDPALERLPPERTGWPPP